MYSQDGVSLSHEEGKTWLVITRTSDGFGGLVVPEFAGSNPAKAVGFFQI
jgi:hypothetical protein